MSDFLINDELAASERRSVSRRSMLALIAVAVALPGTAYAAPPGPKRLRLVNAHTGETFNGRYRDDRAPLASAMADLSAFLRDFHSGTSMQMDVGVIDFLAAVLDAVGATTATILSAYRTPETNAMLAHTTFGVAENSQHMYGRALDIRIDGDLVAAVRSARAMQRGGVGSYPRSNFFHLDTGPVRNWELDGQRFVAGLLDGPSRAAVQENLTRRTTATGSMQPQWANSGQPLPILMHSGHPLPQVK